MPGPSLQAINVLDDGTSQGGVTNLDFTGGWSITVSGGTVSIDQPSSQLFEDQEGFSSTSQVNTLHWFQENSQLSRPVKATKVKVYNAPSGACNIVYGAIDSNGNLDVVGTQAVTFAGGDETFDLETDSLSTDNVFVGFQSSGSARIRYVSQLGYTNSVWYAASDGASITWADNFRLGYELIRPVADADSLEALTLVSGNSRPNGFNLEKALEDSLVVTLPPGTTTLEAGFTLPAGATIKGHSLGSILQLSGTTTGLRINSGEATISDLTIKGEVAAFNTSVGFTSDTDVEAITIGGTIGTDYAILIDSSIADSSDILIQNVVFEDVAGTALYANTTSTRKGPRLSNLTFTRCEVGLYYGSAAEYVLATDITCYDCWYGIVQYAGNVNTSNINITECRVGILLGGDGLNDSHSSIVGGLLNHNQLYSLYAESFSLGWLVSNLNIWEGDIRAVGCAGLSLDHCTITVAIEHEDVVSMTVSNCLFDDLYGGGTFTETGTSSVVRILNNIEITTGDYVGVSSPGEVDPGRVVGFMDYNDTTGSVAVPADTWTTIPNNGLGSFTNKNYPPHGVTDLMDVSTGEIDPTELELGDVLWIRNDFTITPQINNTSLDFRYVLGSGGGEYTLEQQLGRLDRGAGVGYRFSLRIDEIYMGDANTRDNLITLQVKCSGASTLVNAGSVITVGKR